MVPILYALTAISIACTYIFYRIFKSSGTRQFQFLYTGMLALLAISIAGLAGVLYSPACGYTEAMADISLTMFGLSMLAVSIRLKDAFEQAGEDTGD